MLTHSAAAPIQFFIEYFIPIINTNTLENNPMYLSDTLIDQIAQSVMEKINKGELGIGMRLPSVRKYAKTLNVSNETILRAYDKLVVLGYLEARRGSGFYVQRTQTNEPQQSPVKPWMQRGSNVSAWQNILYENDISEQPLPLKPPRHKQQGIDLLQHALQQLDSNTLLRLSQYANPQGFLPLRQQLQQKFAQQGIQVTADQIITTNGATDALHLILWSHFFPDQVIFIEDPTSVIHQQRALASGLNIHRIPRLEDGPDLEVLQTLCEKYKPKAFLMSSILQNPTSSCLSVYKAHQLLKLAEMYNFFIIDDDSFGDLLPESQMINITRLANLDQLSRVIQIGSFSKTIAPGLRSGYIAAQQKTIEHILLYKSVGEIQNSLLTDALVAQILASGDYPAHCLELATQLTPLRQKIKKQLVDIGWNIPETNAGIYLWGSLDEKAHPEALEATNSLAIQHIPGKIFSIDKEFGSFKRFNIDSILK
ncbi:PLP-dependent aminotransferase family protein [Acinetobacter puyangensis]|uniref:aminotransferase-like domain-containing protein n=1 Tax=Acinetobacter puyangensis TaxID=1096779 RepID=UPI003A4D2A89